MSQKIDFSDKSKKMKKNKIKLVIIIIVVILILYILIQSIIRAYKSLPSTVQETDKFYYSVSEFGSLEEILNRYGCAYIRTDESSDIKKIYLTFDRDLYTGKQSNENHFWTMTRVIAEFENFVDFELIDESRNIDIEVLCEDTDIIQFKINGDINYYLNNDSIINSKKEKVNTTDFTIQSEELQELIENGWDVSNVNFGTQDSECNGYTIYFDEGIQYKIVGRKIFNVIYTTKYNGKIVEGLNALSTKEEVENILGEPTYQLNTISYGYRGENNYLFFDFSNQQVSIYPIYELKVEDEKQLKQLIKAMNKTADIKEFASKLTDLWIDYDIYDFASNYVDLQYTLRGIELKISSDSLKNGIYIYQNYLGNFDIQDMDNVYIKDKDIVFEAEKERLMKEQLNRVEQGDYTQEQLNEMGIDFSLRFYSYEEINQGPMFFSRDKSYPDSELSRTLVFSSYKWYDNNKIIYSIDYDGIYIYNCATRNGQKIIDIEEPIEINEAKDGKIVYNEENEISISVQ